MNLISTQQVHRGAAFASWSFTTVRAKGLCLVSIIKQPMLNLFSGFLLDVNRKRLKKRRLLRTKTTTDSSPVATNKQVLDLEEILPPGKHRFRLNEAKHSLFSLNFECNFR